MLAVAGTSTPMGTTNKHRPPLRERVVDYLETNFGSWVPSWELALHAGVEEVSIRVMVSRGLPAGVRRRHHPVTGALELRMDSRSYLTD